MRVLFLISVIITQVMGFLVTRKTSSSISFSMNKVINTKLYAKTEETRPSWQIDGGDTSETECSSSGDIIRAKAAEAEKVVAEENLKIQQALKVEEDLKAEESKKAAVAAAVAAESAKRSAAATSTAAVVATPEVDRVGGGLLKKVVIPGTEEEKPKDLSKLSVGTDGFDVGLLIAFPVIVATLGFFFLFPLIGPQLSATLPPVPPM
eukprot:CAMPEP_0119045306 /NCGR_PEP_ID=MMETSP1177-20130426/38823_1 /TAXON_ID=2985 /ORGANISM="Ochromonas sp, Strain CCMP1899" /LENGTH=206 /DNA_ID=CAMNT_0007016843 /DNA_START=45 /DNA_END=665 /DNA_ORIENTATION=-